MGAEGGCVGHSPSAARERGTGRPAQGAACASFRPLNPTHLGVARADRSHQHEARNARGLGGVNDGDVALRVGLGVGGGAADGGHHDVKASMEAMSFSTLSLSGASPLAVMPPSPASLLKLSLRHMAVTHAPSAAAAWRLEPAPCAPHREHAAVVGVERAAACRSARRPRAAARRAAAGRAPAARAARARLLAPPRATRSEPERKGMGGGGGGGQARCGRPGAAAARARRRRRNPARSAAGRRAPRLRSDLSATLRHPPPERCYDCNFRSNRGL